MRIRYQHEEIVTSCRDCWEVIRDFLDGDMDARDALMADEDSDADLHSIINDHDNLTVQFQRLCAPHEEAIHRYRAQYLAEVDKLELKLRLALPDAQWEGVTL